VTNTAIDAKQLNDRIDPVELLGFIGYAKSRPKISGGEVRDLCPIHEGDNQQSLAIRQEGHCYICHSCKKSGDLIGLYMEATGKDFPTAIKELAARFACDRLPSSSQDDEAFPAQKKQTSTPYTAQSPSVADVAPEKPVDVAAEWAKASDEGHHEYFDRKRVRPCPGVRYGKDKMGNNSIVVPFYAATGELRTLQYINDFGKFFLSGVPKKGAFFTLGNIADGGRAYVAEGLATAATVWEAMGEATAVASAGDAGNIPEVVAAIRGSRPGVEIVLALDNDEAGLRVKDKVPAPFTYCVPSFEGLSIPGGQKAKDFNDLVSVCGLSLEAVRDQIQEKEKEAFFEKLGVALEDNAFVERLKGRNYSIFEQEHKKLFAGGGLVTGFRELDERVLFSKGDFVTIQAMSNHGKSTFMLQLAYQFTKSPDNAAKKPLCIFITYESAPIRIEEKLINIIGHDCGEGTAILYDRSKEEKYLYADQKSFPRTINVYNNLLSQRKIEILKRASLEKLDEIVTLYQRAFPDRMLVLFLDYLQIIDTSIDLVGWELIKAVSRRLEAMAITKEILIVTASQVNDRRQTREGRDLYNSSTTVLDIFNHSHEQLRANQETEKMFKDKVEGEAVCTISAFKQKHGETFDLREKFLFNGFRFKEKPTGNNIDY
jgi:phage/plasmid primase-like uncharacterized protein/KaiC/GvpD/RAD55 family RecA-like ATPase